MNQPVVDVGGVRDAGGARGPQGSAGWPWRSRTPAAPWRRPPWCSRSPPRCPFPTWRPSALRRTWPRRPAPTLTTDAASRLNGCRSAASALCLRAPEDPSLPEAAARDAHARSALMRCTSLCGGRIPASTWWPTFDKICYVSHNYGKKPAKKRNNYIL